MKTVELKLKPVNTKKRSLLIQAARSLTLAKRQIVLRFHRPATIRWLYKHSRFGLKKSGERYVFGKKGSGIVLSRHPAVKKVFSSIENLNSKTKESLAGKAMQEIQAYHAQLRSWQKKRNKIMRENEKRGRVRRVPSRPGIPGSTPPGGREVRMLRRLGIVLPKEKKRDGLLIYEFGIKNRGLELVYDDRGRVFVAFYFKNAYPDRPNESLNGLYRLTDGEPVKMKQRNAILLPVEHEDPDGYPAKLLDRIRTQKVEVHDVQLVERGGEIYIQLTIDEPPAEPFAFQRRYLGIDVGISDRVAWSLVDERGDELENGTLNPPLATDDNGDPVPLFKVYHSLLEKRRENQRAGRRPGVLKLKRREEEILHILSKEIVRLAKEKGAAIVLENIKGLKYERIAEHEGRRTRSDRKKNFFLGQAPLRKLQEMIRYKAKDEKIPVFEISPAYTSRVCPVCTPLEAYRRRESLKVYTENATRKGKKFECKQCGREADADTNAAWNIARVAVLRMKKK
ncbi:MAG: transposase [Brockia lithotrophica]|nr:transposase [Brockia lithotrophica]